MRRNDKRSSHTVNLHNKGGISSQFKSPWLRFHRAVCPPLNLLPLQSNIHGTSTLVQAVWGEAVPKSLVLVGALVRWVCTHHGSVQCHWVWHFSHCSSGGDLSHKDCSSQAQNNENQTNASSGNRWELLTPPLQHYIKNSSIRFLSRQFIEE